MTKDPSKKVVIMKLPVSRLKAPRYKNTRNIMLLVINPQAIFYVNKVNTVVVQRRICATSVGVEISRIVCLVIKWAPFDERQS